MVKRFLTLAVALTCMANSLFAEAPQGQQQLPEQSIVPTLVMIAVGILCFYFILWRPEQKRRKAQEALRSSMKKGDKVSTVAGIVGVVTTISDNIVTVRMSDGAKIDFLKNAIADVMSGGAQAEVEVEVKK